jgi:hypothetical protein
MCVYLKKKLIKLLSSFFGMDFDMCPLLESDMIIPLYTSFNLNKWDEWFRKVLEIWLLKLPQQE